MGRAPCCDKANVKRGPWSPEEDAILRDYMHKFGSCTNWIALPTKAGLKRCGKSCRLRWLNYLRPNIKHGEFSDDEDRVICTLYATIGSRWSIIAGQLPGRTDNDIKNYWNTKLKKKLMGMINIPQQQPSLYHNFITTTTSQFLPPLMNNIINSTITTTTTPDNYMQPPSYFLNETNTSLLANTTSQLLQHSSLSSSFLGNFGNNDQVMMMMNMNGSGSSGDSNRDQMMKQEDQTLLFHGGQTYTKSNITSPLAGNNINAGDKLLNDDALLLEDVKKLICSGLTLTDQDQMNKSIHGNIDEEKNIHYFW